MADPTGKSALRVRLRFETASWHERVEEAADVPHTIRTRGAYVDFLVRLFQLHSSFETRLGSMPLRGAWCSVGVDLSVHRRAHLLVGDLMELGEPTPASSLGSTPFATFGHALGSLYVLEGSSLGGRAVARIVRSALGKVPTSFLVGEGRSLPLPWSNVCSALSRYDSQGGDGDAVVAGACDTFAVFAQHLRFGQRHQPTQMGPPP
jgi:heme oxygenase